MQDIRVSFEQLFNTNAILVVASPGRINLIGEHTDYNHGFVLPAAIDQCVQVAIAKRTDAILNIHALDLQEGVMIPTPQLKPHTTGWVNYIIGVVAQVQKHLAVSSQQRLSKHILDDLNAGFNICFQGNIPMGAGLSSSAAIECAVVYALNELYQIGLSKMQMALISQQAEQEFSGVQCGIMDMFASLHGQKNQVILLDCANLQHLYYPLDLKEYQIILFDTQIKHALALSEYNTRRLECEQGVRILQSKYPSIQTLRDASQEQLDELLKTNPSLLGTQVYNRCKYVVAEIKRVQVAVQYLLSGDIKSFGQKMFETHEGLSTLYEVSCPELDILVNAVKDQPHVLGARMMGGGFGGCTINIVKVAEAKSVIQEVSNIYAKKTGLILKIHQVSIEQGTHIK